MPDAPKPKASGLSTPAGKKKAIIVGGGVLAAIALGLYLRKRIGNGGGTTAASPYVASDGSGGSGGGGVVPGDMSGVPSLADTLNGLIPFLGGGTSITYNYYGSGSGNGSPGTTTNDATAPPAGPGWEARVAEGPSHVRQFTPPDQIPISAQSKADPSGFQGTGTAISGGSVMPNTVIADGTALTFTTKAQTITGSSINHPAVKAAVKPAAQKAAANKDLTKILTPAQLTNLKKVAA